MNVYGWEQFQVSQLQGCVLKNVTNFLKLHFVVRVLFGNNFRSYSCDLSYLDKTNISWKYKCVFHILGYDQTKTEENQDQVNIPPPPPNPFRGGC